MCLSAACTLFYIAHGIENVKDFGVSFSFGEVMENRYRERERKMRTAHIEQQQQQQ